MARIVIMLNRLVIGGAPLDTVQLAGYLSTRHEVYLLVGEKNKDEYDASFLLESYPALKVIHIPEVHRSVNFLKDIKAFFHIKNILKKLQPDIVHTNGAKPGVLGRLAAKHIGVKNILHTYHGHVFHSYFNKFYSSLIVRLERRLAKYSTKIIAISESQKNELVDIYRICSPEKISVINLGIDADRFHQHAIEKRTIFREKYYLSDGEIAVGIVGRIVPIKGHRFFIDVIDDVLKKTLMPVRFFIVGDGSERKMLMDVLREKNIDFVFFPDNKRKSRVTFTSWILEIDEVMNGLDIVALTSFNEGVPITLLEASAASKAVIATNVGAVSEIIDDARTGFVIAPGNKNDFAKKLTMLVEDEQLRKRMGEEACIWINNNYNKNGEIKSIDSLYQSLLSVAKKVSYY